MFRPIFLLPAVMLLALLWLNGVSSAQGSPPSEATPSIGSEAAPAAPSPGMEMGPTEGWPHHMHHRPFGPVGMVLRIVLALSAAFALIALGIFLLRRSSSGGR